MGGFPSVVFAESQNSAWGLIQHGRGPDATKPNKSSGFLEYFNHPGVDALSFGLGTGNNPFVQCWRDTKIETPGKFSAGFNTILGTHIEKNLE